MIQSMSDAELKAFVMGFCDGQIFTNSMVEANGLLHLVFMPLALGGLEGVDLEDLGCIWEWMKEAGPRSINGYPIFFGCRLMNKADTARAQAAIDKEMKRRQQVEI